MVAGHMATAVTNARAYEEERRRSEALAELDRAKTAFFSNVSHEFRTPLTLMLTPLEEVLSKPVGELADETRALLDVAHRNALRLLKLVNSLLNFSRIEVGRVQACYRPLDLGALTADLASNFRSATEKAGLELIVDCPSLPMLIYVDRDMWETIVLNLISNAFKFTSREKSRFRCGPPKSKMPSKSLSKTPGPAFLPRSCRGCSSGFIVLRAREAAPMRVAESAWPGARVGEATWGLDPCPSELGRGSTFTISLPTGMAHLPREQVRNDSSSATLTSRVHAYVEEALRWLPAQGDTLQGAFLDNDCRFFRGNRRWRYA